MAIPFIKKPKNPAPQDLSLFDDPIPEPIKVPSSTTTQYGNNKLARNVNFSDSKNSVLVDDFSGIVNRNREVENINRIDLGAKGKKVSPDAPENGPTTNRVIADDEFYKPANDGKVEGENAGTKPIKINGFTSAKTNAKTKPAFIEDLSKIQIDPLVNELNSFTSVTYNLALYMINSKSYVDLTQQPNDPNLVLDPKSGVSQLLMRSGGTGLDNPNNDFANNFFIDDLEIQNIAVGPDRFKHNTNATEIRFVITEPRGVTLLEKLQRLAGTVLKSTREKYIHAPYLLEIKFKGYDETGRPVPAPSRPKYIPIRITDMTFEVTSAGTQYRVQAIPYANHVLGSIVSTIPHNIELKASTVGDIFDSEVIQSRKVADRIASNPAIARAAGVKEGATIFKTVKTKHRNLAEILTDSRARRTKSQTIPNKDGSVTSIPAAAEKHDTYSFLIADEIAKAELNIEDIYDALNTPTPTEDDKSPTDNKDNGSSSRDKKQYEAYIQGLSRGVTLDKKTKTFSIAAGTNIVKLINLIIMHSNYMDRNIESITSVSPYLKTGDPINWFRVRPVIQSATGKNNGHDAKDGRYKYNIQYVVEKNVIHYGDFPWAKKSKPVGIGYHKKYDYIFSGKNTEVLDFQLKFNVAFLQTMTAGTGSPFAAKTFDTPFSPIVKELPSSFEGNTINSGDTLTRKRAKDLFSSVMSDGVDLVDLDLRIVGDPAWIPTSDAYWQDKVRKGESYTQAFMPDGTINYNLTPPFIQLNLKTPTDYDETTGLQDPSQAGNSSFSGVYRITSCESTFSGGVFQQRLNGFRPPGQDAGKYGAVKSANLERSSTSNNRSLLSGVEDYIIKTVDKKNTQTVNAKVVEDQFEDFDYDAFIDGGT